MGGRYNSCRTVRQLVAGLVVYVCLTSAFRFGAHCLRMAPNLSSPSIMLKGRNSRGEPVSRGAGCPRTLSVAALSRFSRASSPVRACSPRKVLIDDFREAYWWLRDNTPEDARVMAWWDYGYQISGIANRTTIADGNTWNHEHIALLGKCLVSPLPEAHSIAKHLADYVLVWSTRFGGMQVRPTTLRNGFLLHFVDGLFVPSRGTLRHRTAQPLTLVSRVCCGAGRRHG